ncbi:uracil phosphoribosyltransferase [bacterium]|nr:uracil phosphoribosyltransferase [bacterium]
MEVFTSTHPLVHHYLSVIRQQDTETELFAHHLENIATVLAVEATRDLRQQQIEVTTPLENCSALALDKPIILVPILRAGLGMLAPFRRLIPTAQVAHVGMYRDEETLEPVVYYQRIPAEMEGSTVLILDPMLATGGSASQAITFIKQYRPARIKLVNIIAAPAGVERIRQDHEDITVFLGVLDRQLNQRGYILPGLGDAGDRIYGT